MKKILTLLCALLMLLCMAACGDTTTQSGGELQYLPNQANDGYMVVGIGSCQDAHIVIPAKYDGKPVTEIGEKAFTDAKITEVTIPDSVTVIGNSAFKGCSGLTSITIPDSVTSIGQHAFSGCTGLTDITIPESVTSIGYKAFSGCTGLTSVTILDSVTHMELNIFHGCDNLTSLTMPLPEGNSPENPFAVAGLFALDKCPLETLVITSATQIPDGAFQRLSKLTSITLPDGITSIGESAFAKCSELTSITIPDGVTTIGPFAFENCIALTSITLPDSITSIGKYAFENCTRLTGITIPNSVTSIGRYAFSGCTGLTGITFEGTMEQWNTIIIADGWEFNSVNYIIYCTDGEIPKA